MSAPDEHPELAASFDTMLRRARLLVENLKTARQGAAETMLYSRMKVVEADTTETGIFPRKLTQQQYEKPSWWKGTMAVHNELEGTAEYKEFKRQFETATAGGPGVSFDHAMHMLIGAIFSGESLGARDVVPQLLRSASGGPVPGWSEIDVFGVGLKTRSIALSLNPGTMMLRQVEIADYEHEHVAGLPSTRGGLHEYPSAILRLDLLMSTSGDRSGLENRVFSILRLVRAWPIVFGQRVHGTPSRFWSLGRMMLGGTERDGDVKWSLPPKVFLNENSAIGLQTFFDALELKIDGALGANRDAAIGIAFDRYKEAVFAFPMERRIAAAIMGLEAIYFRENETAELSYRLGLRVAKVMAGLGRDPAELQRRLKIAYDIRSGFVHGSFLDQKSRDRHERKATMTLEHLAAELLEWLRMAIVHLIYSGQTKEAFLDLIEASLVYRHRDDELSALISGEKAVLLIPLE